MTRSAFAVGARGGRARASRNGSLLAALLSGCASFTAANGALAGEPAARHAAATKPSSGRRALSAGAALFPGLVAHGTGHFVLRKPATGRRLLYAELAGLGLVAGGGIPIVLTGASRYVVGPGAAVVMVGVGLFGLSLAADIYGTLSADGGAATTRILPPPWLETELGYRHVDDPVFEYEHFFYQRVSLMVGAVRVTPSGWFSTAGDNSRYRLEGAYRLLGATPSPVRTPVANDRVDVLGGIVHHRYSPQGFTRSTAELAIDARYDLGHVGETLRGAFVEAQLGYALGRIDYDVAGVGVPADTDSLLLGRLGFGVVLRGLSKPGSEVTVYYDHRHDDYAAGLVMPGLVSGVLGHFGTDARWFFTQNLGVSLMAEYGSAFISGLSVVFRQSGPIPSNERRGIR